MRRHTVLALAACLGLAPALAARADDTPAKPADERQPAQAEKAARFEIPYRVTDTKHLMVRVKINGTGPYHFIVDTGAPAIFMSKEVAKKAKVKEDEKEWGVFDSFELEGGLKIEKARGRAEDL